MNSKLKNQNAGFALAAVLFLALWAPARAQQGKLPRIGYVSSNSAASPGPLFEAFVQGLRDLGYVDGKNAVFEFRFAEGAGEGRYPELVNELVNLNVDVLVLPTIEMVRLAKRATASIPCVMIVSEDPVFAGLVKSLARPGGNLTGFARLQRQLSGKRLELLTEAAPRGTRVALLYDPGSRTALNGVKEYKSAAQSLKIQLYPIEVESPPDLERVFQKVSAKHATQVVTITTQVLFRRQKEIAALANRHRLPSMFEGGTWVEAGGLMSYSSDDREIFRRAATYVDKILKGTKPADLPVEQPTRFEFVINLKTAKQIGLTIPPNVLARADRVIK